MKTKIILFFCLNVTHFMDDTRHNYRLLVVGRICHTQVRSTALNKAPDNNFFAFIVSIFFLPCILGVWKLKISLKCINAVFSHLTGLLKYLQ